MDLAPLAQSSMLTSSERSHPLGKWPLIARIFFVAGFSAMLWTGIFELFIR